MRKATVVAITLGATALGVAALAVMHGKSEAISQRGRGDARPAAREEPEAPDAGTTGAHGRDAAPRFRMPSGKPTRLSCEAARTIVAQARRQLAYPAPRLTATDAFADAALDWIDPHGLWAIAPRTPLGSALKKAAPALAAELDPEDGASRAAISGAPVARDASCPVARELGATLHQWMTTLKARADKGRARPFPKMKDAVFAVAHVEDAEAIAENLGRSWAAFEAHAGREAELHASRAAAAFLPDMEDTAWSEIVLAGAVRAYVMQLDAHSVWAPFDEEASISEVDLVADAPSMPWTRATMTPFGPELEGVMPPLEDKDVLIAAGELAVAGLSLEQLMQLGYAVAESDHDESLLVLRKGKLVRLVLPPEDASGAHEGELEDLAVHEVPYGRGHVAVIALSEVKDNLGELARDALRRIRTDGDPVGIVIDLRNNGGGSADGAQALLGYFMPHAPLFPTRRGDGAVEVEYAQDVDPNDVWRGPVATLVDGDTASAAEMIAGALASYGRGPSVGMTTFGKGCEQEFLDDDAHQGVLKLTTLIYALPDGSGVQRVGLLPTLPLTWKHRASGEREAQSESSAPAWNGPDVRATAAIRVQDARTQEWPATTHVGPCGEDDLCRALSALGSIAKRSTARKR